MIKQRILITGVIIGIVLVIKSNAGQSYFNFIEEPVSSKIMGMGSAGTSIGKGGFNFYNPAGLSLSDKSFVSVDFTRVFSDIGRVYFESGWVFTSWFVGAAFQTQEDQFQRADETGFLPNAFEKERGTLASITTGLKRERYALAFSFNAVQEIIAENQSYGFSGSAGMIVTIIPKHIYAGLSAIHAAGRHTTFMDKEEKLKSERFPATIRGGFSWQDTLIQRFPIQLSADVVYGYNDELFTVPLGIDFNLLPPISIRIGKRINHPSELFSMGIGLHWKNIAFNAAFTPFRFVTDLHVKRSVGLTYTLAAPADKLSKSTSNEQMKPVKVSPVIEPEQNDSSSKISGDTISTIDSIKTVASDSVIVIEEKDTSQAIQIMDTEAIDSIEKPESQLIVQDSSIVKDSINADLPRIQSESSLDVQQQIDSSTTVDAKSEILTDEENLELNSNVEPVDTTKME